MKKVYLTQVTGNISELPNSLKRENVVTGNISECPESLKHFHVKSENCPLHGDLIELADLSPLKEIEAQGIEIE